MNRRIVAIALGITAAVGGVVGGVVAVHGSGSSNVSLSANSQSEHMARMGRMSQLSGWTFNTLNNSNDPTFNQLLGVNNHGQIAGVLRVRGQAPPEQGLRDQPDRGERLVPERELPARQADPGHRN